MANNLRGQGQRFVKFSDNVRLVGAIILEKLIEHVASIGITVHPLTSVDDFWPPVRKKRDISRVGRSFADV
jgi:hypothetical protein